MKKNKIKEKAPDKVKIRLVPTGVPGLDEILGGGLPEFSFNFIAGAPGCGKTTLAHQIVFANATPQKPALYFTVLGEPALKMLRYQQQYSFFDPAKLNTAIRFINLSETALEKDLSGVLEEITRKCRCPIPAWWWWTPSALWCAKRLATKAKWNCMILSSAWPCF